MVKLYLSDSESLLEISLLEKKLNKLFDIFSFSTRTTYFIHVSIKIIKTKYNFKKYAVFNEI